MRIPPHLAARGIETIVGLDFETFWDRDYTLKKLSTTEYVRDPRFKAQCVGLRDYDQNSAAWFSGRNIADVLATVDWSKTALLAHHAHFDGHILTHHFGCTPAYYLCTLSMARPLHGGEIRNDLDTLSRHYNGRGKHKDYLKDTKGVRNLPEALMDLLGEGCAQDVDEMWRIFECMLPHYPVEELDLIHHTVRAYVEPVLRVDARTARVAHKLEVRRKRRLLARVALPDTVLRSRPKFATELEKLGVEPPMKVSPATGKPTYAFAKDDLEFQDLLEHVDPRVRDLVEARLAVSTSLEETRAVRLLSHAEPALPIYLNYGKVHTLRWSGGDKMNPQNFGRESLLRRAILAPPGHKLVIVDSAQIEARMNAWLAGEDELVEAFRDPARDIYKEFAAESIFGCSIEEIDKIRRFCGKVCILGLGFQMWILRFKYTLESGKMGMAVTLPEELYERAVVGFRNRFSAIVKQWSTMQDMLAVMFDGREHVEYGPLLFQKGRVRLPNGMYLLYPRLKPESVQHIGGGNGGGMFKARPAKTIYRDWTYNGESRIYGGLLTENVVQALARCVVAEQILLSIADKHRVTLLVHDEVVLCVPEEDAEQALKDTLEAFHTPPTWASDLPVAGEGWISDHYSKR